jgi:HEAT repeat protein
MANPRLEVNVARVREESSHWATAPIAPPSDVNLTAGSVEAWRQLTTSLQLEPGPSFLFVVVDAPSLRERLGAYLANSLTEAGFPVNHIDLDPGHERPAMELVDAIEREPGARMHLISGLEKILPSGSQAGPTLSRLSLGRERISRASSGPIVFWLDSQAFKALASGAVSFMQWRAGEFRLEEDEGPMADARARYRQHIIDRFSKLKPLGVDLERVFVKLTATEAAQLAPPSGELGSRISFRATGAEIAEEILRQRSLSADFNAANPNEEAAAEQQSPNAPTGPKLAGAIRAAEAQVRRPASLNEALAEHLELAVIGAPGSGKTTLLKYIALSFARRQAKYRLGLDEDRLPVIVTLRDFNKFVEEVDRSVTGYPGPGSESLESYVTWFHDRHFPSLKLPAGFFAALLSERGCVVLMDGLDEVADSSKRERIARFVESCAEWYYGNRFVVTSRPRGYEAGRQYLAGRFNECTIQDLDEEQIISFVTSWYLAVTLDREGDTLTARDHAAKSAEDLREAIKSEQIRPLATNPLLLSILALIHQRGNRLPQRRVALYEECIEFLLGFWRQVQGGEAARELAGIGGLTLAEKRLIIEPVALWLHERGESGAEVSLEELEQQVALQFEELFGRPKEDAIKRAASFVDIIVDHAGLLVERETGVFTFAHLTFQEFLAARALADRGDYIEFIRPRLHDPWWREVILLLAGYLSTPCTRRSRTETAGLLNAIRGAASPLEEVLHRDLLLAFRSLCDSEQLGVDQRLRAEMTAEVIHLWRQTPSPALRDEIEELFAYAAPTPVGKLLVPRLLELSQDPSADVRVSAAYALGRLGAAAATPAVLARLVELIQDSSDDVRGRAADALGSSGAAAATPAVLARLVELIQDSSDFVRGRAADALGSLGATAATPAVLARLVELIQDSSDFVRGRAVYALGRLGAAAATPAVLARLVELIHDSSDDVRGGAAHAIESLGATAATPPVLARLLDFIQDPNRSIRVRAALALWRLGTAAATPDMVARLVELSHDSREDVRISAANGLGRLGGAATPQVLARLLELSEDSSDYARGRAAGPLGNSAVAAAATPQVLARLLELSRDSSEFVRVRASQALGCFAAANPDVVSWLANLAKDARDHVRNSAAYELGMLGAAAATPQVLAMLVELIQDSSDGVCGTAAQALGRLGAAAATPQVLAGLVELIQHSSNDVRGRAADALGRLGAAAATPAAVARLVELSQDSSDYVRRSAAHALGRLGAAAATPQVLAMLVELLQDSSYDVRDIAANALGSLGAAAATPAVLTRLVELSQHPSNYVRRSAVYALGGLGAAAAPREILSRMIGLVGRIPSLNDANIAFGLGRARERLSPLEVDKLIRFWTVCLGSKDSGSVGGGYQSLDSAAYRQLHDLAALVPRTMAVNRKPKSRKRGKQI